MEKWQTVDSKVLVEDRWIKLRADTCVTPEGHTIAPFYVLEYSDWANCLVLDDNNDVITVKHYRHGIDDFVPELVSGGVEEGESRIEGMKRELAEELGYTGGELYQTGISYANPASHNNKVYSFIAVGGRCDAEQKLEAGEHLEIQKLSFKDFVERFGGPDMISQSLHLTAAFFAMRFIKNSDLDSLQDLKKFL